MIAYWLYGGHHHGRTVHLDGPAPPYLQVAYREPCTDLGCTLPLCGEAGIETYELTIVTMPYGPPIREYICRSVPPVVQ
jgi:hypothetical protein